MITSLENTQLLQRRALVDVSGELLGQCANMLIDAGFLIVASAAPAITSDGVVRLVIQGDALPPECDTGPHLVKLQMTQEAYGNQRFVRIDRVDLIRRAPSTVYAAA